MRYREEVNCLWCYFVKRNDGSLVKTDASPYAVGLFFFPTLT